MKKGHGIELIERIKGNSHFLLYILMFYFFFFFEDFKFYFIFKLYIIRHRYTYVLNFLQVFIYFETKMNKIIYICLKTFTGL